MGPQWTACSAIWRCPYFEEFSMESTTQEKIDKTCWLAVYHCLYTAWTCPAKKDLGQTCSGRKEHIHSYVHAKTNHVYRICVCAAANSVGLFILHTYMHICVYSVSPQMDVHQSILCTVSISTLALPACCHCKVSIYVHMYIHMHIRTYIPT
jgi:hypothetical protein